MDYFEVFGLPRKLGIDTAALIASLPPVWSGCQWVFQICVIRQSRRAASSSTGSDRIALCAPCLPKWGLKS